VKTMTATPTISSLRLFVPAPTTRLERFVDAERISGFAQGVPRQGCHNRRCSHARPVHSRRRRGYLQADFPAIGAQLRGPSKLFDEQISFLDTVWSGKPFNLSNEHWVAADYQQLPTPIQRPGPQTWVRDCRRQESSAHRAYWSRWTPVMTPAGAAPPLVPSAAGLIMRRSRRRLPAAEALARGSAPR
jgi:hypothetical protein